MWHTAALPITHVRQVNGKLQVIVRVLKKVTKLCNRKGLQKFFQHKIRPIIFWRAYSIMDNMEDILPLREPLHQLLNVDIEPPAEERFAEFEQNMYKLPESCILQIIIGLYNFEDLRQVCVVLHMCVFVCVCV